MGVPLGHGERALNSMAMWRRVLLGEAGALIANGSDDCYFCITQLFPLTPRDVEGGRVADHSWPKVRIDERRVRRQMRR